MSSTSDEHVEHLATLLCQEVRREPSGIISAIGLIDMIEIAALPPEPVLATANLHLLVGWRRNKEPGAKINFRLVFETRDPEPTRLILGPPLLVDLSYVHLASAIIDVKTLPLHGYKQYFFVVQRERDGVWEDSHPSAGLFVAQPRWRHDRDQVELRRDVRQVVERRGDVEFRTTDILNELGSYPSISQLGSATAEALHELAQVDVVEYLGTGVWKLKKRA